MGFWIGFIVGGVTIPALLALISKPLMVWMAKKQLNNMTNSIMGKLQNQFPVNGDGKENSETR